MKKKFYNLGAVSCSFLNKFVHLVAYALVLILKIVVSNYILIQMICTVICLYMLYLLLTLHFFVQCFCVVFFCCCCCCFFFVFFCILKEFTTTLTETFKA